MAVNVMKNNILNFFTILKYISEANGLDSVMDIDKNLPVY